MEHPSRVFQVSFVEELSVTVMDIATKTRKDNTLATLYQCVVKGWPHKIQEGALKPYYQHKDQLAIDQGCLLQGLRVIIPPTLQAQLLNALHVSNPNEILFTS